MCEDCGMSDICRFTSFPSFCGVPSVPVDEIDPAGADIVEVSPPHDGPGQITAFLANRVVLEVLNGVAERKLGIV